jgi:hypothetical protein
VNYRDDLLNLRVTFHLNCPNSLGEELDKQLQLKGNKAIS